MSRWYKKQGLSKVAAETNAVMQWLQDHPDAATSILAGLAGAVGGGALGGALGGKNWILPGVGIGGVGAGGLTYGGLKLADYLSRDPAADRRGVNYDRVGDKYLSMTADERAAYEDARARLYGHDPAADRRGVNYDTIGDKRVSMTADERAAYEDARARLYGNN